MGIFHARTVINCLYMGIYGARAIVSWHSRSLAKSAYYDSDSSQLEMLGWKNLECQRNIQKATMIFKCLHGLAPEYLASKFSKRNTNYNLRDSENKLDVQLPRTNYLKNSFSYSGTTLWNMFPSLQGLVCRVPQVIQTCCHQSSLKAYLHGTTLSHATSLRKAYHMT